MLHVKQRACFSFKGFISGTYRICRACWELYTNLVETTWYATQFAWIY